MDQDKVNPFVGNTEAPAGGAPVSDVSASSSSTAASGSAPSVPVNPYAPAGAPYAPGSNTPAPDFATPYAGGTYDSPSATFSGSSVSEISSDGPAVPNTGAYTSFSPAPSQDPIQFSNAGPEKPKLFTKKFIIFAIIGLVLIIAAVVAGVIVQNNRTEKGTSVTVKSNDYQSSLNTYINYITLGSNSSERKDFAYDENGSYFLTLKLHDYAKSSSKEDAKIAMSDAKKYFDVYYEKVPDDKKTSSEESGTSIELYRDILNLLSYIVSEQPNEAGDAATKFIQELHSLDLGPATIYATLYDKYIESGKSDDAVKDLDGFINSYAAYLVYNIPELEGGENE